MGGDLHLDGLDMGSGYIGYSHVSVDNGRSRAGAAGRPRHVGNRIPQRLLRAKGRRLEHHAVERLRHRRHRAVPVDLPPVARVRARAARPRDHAWPLRHVQLRPQPVAAQPAQAEPSTGHDENIHEHKFKGGVEVEVQAHKYLNVGVASTAFSPSIFDRDPTYWANIVQGLSYGTDAFTTVSPRLIIHTNWKSKELIVVDYTHYFLGPRAYVGSPYSTILKADPNMLAITVLFSF